MVFAVPVTVMYLMCVGAILLRAPRAWGGAKRWAITLLLLSITFSWSKVEESDFSFAQIEGCTLSALSGALLLVAVPGPSWARRMLNSHWTVDGALVVAATGCVLLRTSPDILGPVGRAVSSYPCVCAAAVLAVASIRNSPLRTPVGLYCTTCLMLTCVLAGSGGDKGPLVVAAVVWATILLDGRVPSGVRLLLALAVAISGICILDLAVEQWGYASSAEFFQNRVQRQGLNSDTHVLVAGQFSDGGRLALWRDALVRLGNHPFTGLPLGYLRDEIGNDEHNGLVFVLCRTGLSGIVWTVGWSVLAWRSLRTFAWNDSKWIAACIFFVPVSIYMNYGDVLSSPYLIIVLSLPMIALMASLGRRTPDNFTPSGSIRGAARRESLNVSSRLISAVRTGQAVTPKDP